MAISVERYDRDWFPPAVARFVEAVEAGRILKTTEFAGAVSVSDSNRFRDAGQVEYDSGALGQNGAMVTLLFRCRSVTGEQGIAAFLTLDAGTVRRIDIVAKDIVPYLH